MLRLTDEEIEKALLAAASYKTAEEYWEREYRAIADAQAARVVREIGKLIPLWRDRVDGMLESAYSEVLHCASELEEALGIREEVKP